MHRLIGPARGSHDHQAVGRRRRPERGVTAVVVAIAMVMLVGFAAIAVDVGALWWDKKQLQNGADAGALALAQACAQDEGICPSDANDWDRTATEYAKSNDLAARDDTAGKVSAIDRSGGSVTVETRTVREAWFSRIWGREESPLTAEARAKWGAPLRESVLPITAATCGFDELGSDAFGTSIDIVFKDSKEMGTLELLADGTVDCEKIVKDGARDYAGGFGWLAQGDKSCIAEIDLGTGYAPGKPGVTNAACFKAFVERLIAGEVVEVELPLFDKVPAHKEYRISGFITLKLTAVCFNPAEYPTSKKWCSVANAAEGRKENSLFIRGEFVKRTMLSSSGGGGPTTPYGTTVVWLSD